MEDAVKSMNNTLYAMRYKKTPLGPEATLNRENI